jgi:hypothetical protein
MRFLSMVKHTEGKSSPPSKAMMDAVTQFMQEVAKEGCVMVQSGGLFPTSAGARVRLAGGKVTVTDGPFAEAKEVVGGYWMIEVKSRDEAIEWAKRCPASENEVIEIRQVQEMADFPPDVQKAAAGFEAMQKGAGPGRK